MLPLSFPGPTVGGIPKGNPTKARQNYAARANHLNNNLRGGNPTNEFGFTDFGNFDQGGMGGGFGPGGPGFGGGFNPGAGGFKGGFARGGFNQTGAPGPARPGKFNNRYNPVGFNNGGGYY